MNSNPPDAADRSRRMMGAAGAALALAGATQAAQAAAARSAATVALPTRARWELPQTWAIPKSSNSVYVTPFVGTPVFNDGDCTMRPDYTISINTTGLYLLSIGFDWADNPNQQVGLRVNGIGHTTPDNPPGKFHAGQLTVVTAKNDRLGQYDVSSSNFARSCRFSGPWKIGTIGKNSTVSIDVTVDTPGVVGLGDVATASHSGITSSLQAGVAALVTTAKVIGPDTVRVTIWNCSQTQSVPVPPGLINVVAMSAQARTGDAPLGRSVLMSATETLTAGDLVYGYFKSTQGGDQLLASSNTYIQIERWA